MRLRNVASTLAATSLLTGALIGLAAPAQAALSECDQGNACIWQHKNYDDLENEYAYHMPAYNNGSSIHNNGFCGNLSIAYYFDASNYSGPSIAMYCPGSGRQNQDPFLENNAHPNGGNWNDKISSASFGN
jgi:hypothetical protein